MLFSQKNGIHNAFNDTPRILSSGIRFQLTNGRCLSQMIITFEQTRFILRRSTRGLLDKIAYIVFFLENFVKFLNHFIGEFESVKTPNKKINQTVSSFSLKNNTFSKKIASFFKTKKDEYTVYTVLLDNFRETIKAYDQAS